MTAQTPVYGLKYIVEGEPLREARLALENNAKTIEAALVLGGIAPPAAQDLATLSGRVTATEKHARGEITSATLTTNFGGATPTNVFGTETVIDRLAFTAVAGRRYKVTWDAPWVASATMAAHFRLRGDNGSNIAINATVRKGRKVDPLTPVGGWNAVSLVARISGLAAGPAEIIATAQVTISSGFLQVRGEPDNQRTFLIEDIGAP